MTDFWDTAVGRSARLTRVFTAADLAAYARLAGGSVTDTVPTPLVASLFSQLLGTDLPGHGSLYLNQTLDFPRAVTVGQPVTATITVTSTRPAKALLTFDTVAATDEGEVCRGSALVMARQHLPSTTDRV